VAADGCADPDGDGISTAAGDNCPAVSNAGQADTDGNGTGDACQAAPPAGPQISGFFQPVDNLPTVNKVKAGSSIPVKFTLDGDYGLNIFAAGSPSSRPVDCTTSAPLDAIEETVTAGGSSLSYDATSQRYHYVWKTDTAWAGTCRRLTVTLAGGSTREALFMFAK
jgi:hypothetical protein